jgi:hypothetical protein
MYVCMYVCMYLYVYVMYVCMHIIYMYVCMCVYVRMCIYSAVIRGALNINYLCKRLERPPVSVQTRQLCLEGILCASYHTKCTIANSRGTVCKLYCTYEYSVYNSCYQY